MKNELIKIETREGFGRCVSLRELYEGLGINTQFTKWAIRMIEYGFTENIDFILVSQKRLINNTKNPFTEQTDYIITTDMAKEICMIQRSDKRIADDCVSKGYITKDSRLYNAMINYQVKITD